MDDKITKNGRRSHQKWKTTSTKMEDDQHEYDQNEDNKIEDDLN